MKLLTAVIMGSQQWVADRSGWSALEVILPATSLVLLLEVNLEVSGVVVVPVFLPIERAPASRSSKSVSLMENLNLSRASTCFDCPTSVYSATTSEAVFQWSSVNRATTFSWKSMLATATLPTRSLLSLDKKTLSQLSRVLQYGRVFRPGSWEGPWPTQKETLAEATRQKRTLPRDRLLRQVKRQHLLPMVYQLHGSV